MVPLISVSSTQPTSSATTTSSFIWKQPIILPNSTYLLKLKNPSSPLHKFHIKALPNNAFESSNVPNQERSQNKTLFPGGYKRPEIKVPNIVLQLNDFEVLNDNTVIEYVDFVVAKWVGIVVINGEGSGGALYEAACLLKSVIRDRAYLLVAERVDVAAAVNASGVLLSDQGLPPIVARKTLMSSKLESVVLPVVGRIVQSVKAALAASSAEGADFLICNTLVEESVDIFMNSIYKNVKIPVFIELHLVRNSGSFNEVWRSLPSGTSGVASSLDELKSMGDDLGRIFYDSSIIEEGSLDEATSFNKLNVLNTNNGFSGNTGISSFVKLEDKEMQFIIKERRLLQDAVDTIKKAAPLMEEISLLNDAIAQLDEPFLLVIVVIEC